jgi:hypothetical protein
MLEGALRLSGASIGDSGNLFFAIEKEYLP